MSGVAGTANFIDGYCLQVPLCDADVKALYEYTEREHKKAFQAGLKKAAEIVSDFAAYRTTSEGKPEWGVLLEQAILKEVNGERKNT